jgi:hypothetical protein
MTTMSEDVTDIVEDLCGHKIPGKHPHTVGVRFASAHLDDPGSWVLTEMRPVNRRSKLRCWVAPCGLCGEHFHISCYDVGLLPNPRVTEYCTVHRSEDARRRYLRANLGLDFFVQKQCLAPDPWFWLKHR